ncbi:hypothetical protein EYZ11_012831 [Aspergillus tanneri]|uniref:MACPF-like domain-containing protein n=1 Tax=Aspergillus tanneri TaxID=1220188 RepID=A0A4S3J4L4_9EURO|nr:hypothetical protein EYZ11_012831 [Aspergillus tanneri]
MTQIQYIAVDTPKGNRPLVSVKVSDLGANPTLTNVRSKCLVPTTHAFSANESNPISDETTLEEYISLTSSFNGVKKTDTSTAGEDSNNSANTSNSQGIQTIRIKLVSLSPVKAEKEEKTKENLAQSTVGKDLKDLLKSFRKPVEAGELSNTAALLGNLASLQESYITKANTKAYIDAADLTETQWENILFNNRLLHGYYYNDENGILIKAPKRAFAIKRPVATPDPTRGLVGSDIPANNKLEERKAIPPKTETEAPGVREYLNTLPGIPLFHVHDDSSITVVEAQTAFQKKMADQGFNSAAIEANLGLLSASGSWQDEKSHATVNRDVGKQTSLHVAYKFPRVAVDLSPEYLQLSDECWNDILQITDLDGVDRFEKQYGNAFPTQVMLGGFLHSSRFVDAQSTDHLEKIKAETKTAAGISFASPKLSLGVNYAKANGNEDEKSSGAAYQNANLAWEARGGDTTLCSNPPEWANTVKDYRNWRITEQSHMLSLKKVISQIDYLIYQRLEYPSNALPTTTPKGQTDALIRAFAKLLRVPNDPKLKSLAGFFSRDDSLNDFNTWLKQHGREKLLLGEDRTWDKLNPDQKIFYGWYAVEKKGFPNPSPTRKP